MFRRTKECVGTFTCRFRFALLLAAVLIVGGIVAAYVVSTRGA